MARLFAMLVAVIAVLSAQVRAPPVARLALNRAALRVRVRGAARGAFAQPRGGAPATNRDARSRREALRGEALRGETHADAPIACTRSTRLALPLTASHSRSAPRARRRPRRRRCRCALAAEQRGATPLGCAPLPGHSHAACPSCARAQSTESSLTQQQLQAVRSRRACAVHAARGRARVRPDPLLPGAARCAAAAAAAAPGAGRADGASRRAPGRAVGRGLRHSPTETALSLALGIADAFSARCLPHQNLQVQQEAAVEASNHEQHIAQARDGVALLPGGVCRCVHHTHTAHAHDTTAGAGAGAVSLPRAYAREDTPRADGVTAPRVHNTVALVGSICMLAACPYARNFCAIGSKKLGAVLMAGTAADIAGAQMNVPEWPVASVLTSRPAPARASRSRARSSTTSATQRALQTCGATA
jgi:hypothetical protein